MPQPHLFYQNFIALIENRPQNMGWHWRGDAEIKKPKNLQNCPFPLKQIFKDIHAQLLQWNARIKQTATQDEHISGEMYLLDVDTFDTPLRNVSMHILGKNRTGKLYNWVENGVFEEIDYVSVGVYIFVDDADKNFCHLVLENEQFLIPTLFNIEDFLFLLAETRGIQGLYANLGRGVEGRFLRHLFMLKDVFEHINMDSCIHKLYAHHKHFFGKNMLKIAAINTNNLPEKVLVSHQNGNFSVLVEDILFFVDTDTAFDFVFVQQLYDGLAFAGFENKYSDNQIVLVSIESPNMIFSAELLEKNLLLIKNIYLAENPILVKEALCDAQKFYAAFLDCLTKMVAQENNLSAKEIWAWEHKKVSTMLRFLYADF